jgi:DeoR/GlpR family transcriptional regulator of sugar metabolism
MATDERLVTLVHELQRSGRIDIGPTAAQLGITEMTIRRDLDVLVRRGIARRVRGGAVSLLTRGSEVPYWMRELESLDAKRRIGAAAAALIADGGAVAIDSGSTAVHCANSLADRRLTVVAVSLRAAAAVVEGPDIQLIVPGGEIRREEQALAGPATVAAVTNLRLDVAILSACGLADATVTAYDLGDAAVKRALVDASAKVIVVADSSKLDRTAMAVVCGAARVDVLVTDTDADAAALKPWRDAGVEVIRA